MSHSSFASVPELVEEIAAGRMVVLVDDEDRENEGDVILAADKVTPEAINFMAKYCRGLICLTLSPERCDALELPPMVQRNGTKHGTAFTVSIEAAEGVETGISVADRARTIQVAVAADSTPDSLVQPGHVFPLRAAAGGVLMRAGHTEAGCDLTRMAGLQPASVICEIMNDDGTMARLPDLIEFAKCHNIKLGSIADLIRYRSQSDRLITLMGERPINTPHGAFQLRTYRDQFGGAHLALSVGRWSTEDEVMVRVHEPVSIMDWLDVQSDGHSWPLTAAMQEIQANGVGVILLLNANESPDDLIEIATQKEHVARHSEATPEADWRTFGIGAQLLLDLRVSRMKVLGNQRRFPSLGGFGLQAESFVSYQP
jgi:3,4-dihydroxy 2-butanone 4-phosphate synthase/GTP cyclohydrolase II